jgi:hypothetical protein
MQVETKDLIDFIAKVKDDRILKGAAAAANNFRPCEKVGEKACNHAFSPFSLSSRVLFLAESVPPYCSFMVFA